MDRLLYTAMNGASRAMHNVGTISHNIANANTAGFKAALVRASTEAVEGAGLPTRFNAIVNGDGHDASMGSMHTTGQPLDIALHSGHWLAVQAQDGSTAYTRAGDLRLDEFGQIQTASGHGVLGADGTIALPPSATISIGADGAVSIIPQGQPAAAPAEIDTIRVMAEPPAGMQRRTDGLFEPVDQGEMTPGLGNVLVSGALEESNVSVATALVDMIAQQRQFETQVKLMKKADENAQRTAELMRLS